jgi:glycosyltransferase involved in cell wall biosynthesis
MALITEPYLLFACVPMTLDASGRRFSDPLWVKDLELHMEYIADLALACPVVYGTPSDGERALTGPLIDQLKLVPLPAPRSRLAAAIALPAALARVWRAVGVTQIVHAGFGGWPINEGWLACPIAKLRGRFLLTNVESSFWRATPDAPWHRRLKGFVAERLNRLCVRAADLRLFTSAQYLREFLREGAPRAYVTPATWIDDECMLSEASATATWDTKSGPVRLLFAGRLIPAKGVSNLLQAVRTAGQQGAEFELTVVGDGPLRDECLTASREVKNNACVVVTGTVPYGTDFFALLRSYDALLVPSLTDEQPRVIFDAFSQAVPVIGSNTGGIRELVEGDETGRLVEPGNRESLVAAIVWASRNRPSLRVMGLKGLTRALGHTHRAMHGFRFDIIRQALNGR